MWIYDYLISANILDIIQDSLFYIQYQYPQLFNFIESLFVSLYSTLITMFMFLYNSLWVMFNMKYLNSAIFNMGIKFILLIALLVFVRGGIPRYRFDFLTKIGWIKFLSLILSIFLSSMLLIFLF